MATAIDIITRAMRSIGVLASGETPSANQANDALVSLNDLLASLANESLTIYAETTDSLTLDGSTSYTYGTGGDINSVRPISINRCYFRNTDGSDYEVRMITAREYADIGVKDTSTDFPDVVYINTTFPLTTIYPWPLSSVGTLYFDVNKAITAFATLQTTVTLPPGYDRMLRYGLGVELMDEYGIQSPLTIQKYADAKADLKRTNTKPVVLRTRLPFGANYGRADIRTDGI